MWQCVCLEQKRGIVKAITECVIDVLTTFQCLL